MSSGEWAGTSSESATESESAGFAPESPSGEADAGDGTDTSHEDATFAPEAPDGGADGEAADAGGELETEPYVPEAANSDGEETPEAADAPEKKPLLESKNADLHPGQTWRSARAFSDRAHATAIQSDVGESEAYKEALRSDEIGLQRPTGANVQGVDFVTAKEIDGEWRIVATDVKTTSVGGFPTPKTELPVKWETAVRAAVDRVELDDKGLERDIRDAIDRPIVLRQVEVDYSPKGGGKISGI